jgi:fatty-acyl-CoA synthase
MPVRFAERAAEAYGYPLLIKQLLHTPLATAADQEIVYRDCHRYTYRDLRRRIGKLASGLSGIGVEAGTTVAVMEWDSHRYLECFFAIPMMGAVLQTVNIRLSAAQILYTLRHAGAEVILVHRDFLPLLQSIRDQLPAVRAFVLMEDGRPGESTPAWVSHLYEELVERASEAYTFEDFDENAIATTFYTTGTTGDPKGVCFSHRQVVLHALGILCAAAMPAHGQSFHQGDVYMPMTPMFHVQAWGHPYMATLMGVKQVYPGRYVPEELLALRARESVTFSHCVPTIVQMILAAAETQKADLRGWKITVGGSAMSNGLARAALERGMDVYAGYGMSETGPVLSITRLAQPAGSISLDQEIERRCRTGLPIPLVDLRIVDPNGNPLPWDDRASGEIVVRAPWLTPCYVGNQQASDELWQGGYLHTQDLARIDPSGYIQITDRLKDVIKSGGEWLSSLQLENLISRHPAVAEVAVIAVPDQQWGERPHVLVVVRPERRVELQPEDIRDFIAAAAEEGVVPRYAVCERITFVDSLDRTSVGKINKRALRERYR